MQTDIKQRLLFQVYCELIFKKFSICRVSDRVCVFYMENGIIKANCGYSIMSHVEMRFNKYLQTKG